VLRPNGNYVIGFSGQGSGLLFSAVPTYPLANQSTTGSATLGNVDGVPGDEIFVVTPDRLWCFKRNGLVLWKLDFTSRFTATYQIFPEPALGDVNRDNLIDVALVDASAKLHLLRGSSGQAIPPFPIQLETGVYYGSCILANVDEGPEPEIVFGDNKQRIHAYTFRGEIARGFPIHFGGKLMHQSLAAWDIDEDGFQNLVVQANQSTRLSVYDLSSSPFPQDPVEQAKQNPWPMRSRDPRNTGRYTNEPPVAVRLQAEAPVLAEDGGVFLAWSTAEAVQLFRIRRSASAEDEALLVGEVPGRAGGASERYTFTDRPPAAGRYVYRINPVNLAGEEEPGPLVAVLVGPPAAARFGIQRVSPDPLTRGREATIAFGLPDAGTGSREVRLEVFDLQGRRVAALVQGERAPGTHFVVWDGRDDGGRPVTTGLYLLRLQAGGQAGARRLLVVR